MKTQVHVLQEGIPLCLSGDNITHSQLAKDAAVFPKDSESCKECSGIMAVDPSIWNVHLKIGWHEQVAEEMVTLHLADTAGMQLCDGSVPVLDVQMPEGGMSHVQLCRECANISREQMMGQPFGGEEPPSRYLTDEQRAELDQAKEPWDKHTEDCCPGELSAFGAAIATNEQFVKEVYQWFAQSLAEMCVSSGWDAADVVRVIRFMSLTAMYFHTGECFNCGDVVNEEVNYEYNSKRSDMAPAEGDDSGGSPVRSEGDQPEPAEGG